MKFALSILLLTALLAALVYSGKRSQPAWAAPTDAAGTATIPTGELWRNGIGYIDNHLAGFRRHVNNVREQKCLARIRPVSSAAELAAMPDAQRRVVRVAWKRRHWQAHGSSASCTPWWVTAQINAGNVLGRESAGDPWPNCPDPWDGSGVGWQGTVDCENGGRWLDSPGFYRCGLQFHPDWENRFGRLCP